MDRCAVCRGWIPDDTPFCPACGSYRGAFQSRGGIANESADERTDQPANGAGAGRKVRTAAAVLLLSVLAAGGGWSLSGALREDAGTAKHLERLSAEVVALQARVGDERRCAERFRSAGEDAVAVNRRLLALFGQLTGEGDGSAMADHHDAALSAVISHYYQGFRAAWYGSLDTAADWIESGNAYAREAQRWKATYDEHRTAVERDVAAMTIELQELESSWSTARCERAVDARSGGRPAA